MNTNFTIGPFCILREGSFYLVAKISLWVGKNSFWKWKRKQEYTTRVLGTVICRREKTFALRKEWLLSNCRKYAKRKNELSTCFYDRGIPSQVITLHQTILVIWPFPDRASWYRIVSNYQLNAQFLYSLTIYMLHYNPQHVSSSTFFIFRRTNCIITASGIVTLLKGRLRTAYCTAVYREWR